MQALLREIWPEEDVIYNGFYNWLVGPSGQPLQLDIFYPNLPLAIEVDGRHHDHFIKRIHKTREQFEHLQACDRAKDEICKQLGIPLVRIKHYHRLTLEAIIKRLKQAGVEVPAIRPHGAAR